MRCAADVSARERREADLSRRLEALGAELRAAEGKGRDTEALTAACRWVWVVLGRLFGFER